MRESLEKVREPVNPLRAAVLSVLMSVIPTSAKAALPDCHDIKSHPVPTESVDLEGGERATVECIVDGDTFDVRLKDDRILRIRLWGVDCPESREEIEKCSRKGKEKCQEEVGRGKVAKELTRQLLEGATVTLEGKFENIKHRKQAYVIVDGKDFGKMLLGICVEDGGRKGSVCEEKYSHEKKREYREVAKACR